MANKRIEIGNDEALIGAQLQIGKQVMKELFELHTDKNRNGVILPIELNGTKFNVTIEKEEDGEI
ncbi:hypothetical protein AB6M97_08880 [Streptococcus hillyeri]|uniref:hypothetical protein n=1 Tax=Streptococcus hillyeri TaxID=2282420 RepID=UPI0034E1B3B4